MISLSIIANIHAQNFKSVFSLAVKITCLVAHDTASDTVGSLKVVRKSAFFTHSFLFIFFPKCVFYTIFS